VAVLKHLDSKKNKENIDKLLVEARDYNYYKEPANEEEYNAKRAWQQRYIDEAYYLQDNENYRNVLGIVSGVFATAGIVTFFF
jgi:hypothetical protein